MHYGVYPAGTAHGYPQYAYYAPQQPIFPSTQGPASRTISIFNFPEDVKERELNNLLLFLPGYQVCIYVLHFPQLVIYLNRILRFGR